jgi:major membrane immunogen (membrane-anchored lipoprotein)
MISRVIKMSFLLAIILMLLPLAACQKTVKQLQDGKYHATSTVDDEGAYAKVTLTISNHQISTVDFKTYQKDGTVKDENYGKINGEISNQTFYDKAQLAVNAMKIYQEQLVAEKSLDKVAVISGATISYNQFHQAVEKALKVAQN